MNKLAKLVSISAAYVCGAVLISTVKASTDGVLGNTSKGSLKVSLNIEEVVKIFNISKDITMNWSNFDLSQNKLVSELVTFTVYRNLVGAPYSILFSSENSKDSKLILSESSSKTVEYTVQFYPNKEGSGNVSEIITNNQEIKGVAGAVQDIVATVKNASLKVVIDPVGAVGGIKAGSYSDTLTMTVGPE